MRRFVYIATMLHVDRFPFKQLYCFVLSPLWRYEVSHMDNLSSVFLNNGWKWSAKLLNEVASTLLEQSVIDGDSLVGLDVNDVVGAELWPNEVKVFITNLAKVSCFDFVYLKLCFVMIVARSTATYRAPWFRSRPRLRSMCSATCRSRLLTTQGGAPAIL